MVRPLVVLVLAALLGGCAVSSPGGWSDRAGGPGVRWGGPYGGVWRGDGDDYYRRGYGYGYPPPVRRDYGGRTFRPDRNVVCDRRTETCYRGKQVDASETREYFGRSAARRVDRVRDAAGTNRIFLPEDDVVCNRRERVCAREGRPHRGETREYFGRKAARNVPRRDGRNG